MGRFALTSDKKRRSILLIVFFFSGATALVYQLAWIRMFGFVFGVSVFAISTVLTAFMTGLALGNYLFGRLVDTSKNALTLFAFLQLGIGSFALTFPFTFKAFEFFYLSFHQLFPTSFYISSLIRFVFSFFFLLIPTTLMGGTLPVLTKYFVKNLGNLGHNVGTLYSVNNLGAFIGCFAAGFLLVQMWGTTETIVLAAVINIIIAFVVFYIHTKGTKGKIEKVPLVSENIDKSGQTTYSGFIVKLALWVFVVEGFTTLSYEVIWTRILVGFSFDKSVYFTSTVILSFIFGLSVGSWLVSFFVDRHKNLPALLGWIEMGIGLVAIALLPVFSKIGAYLESVRPLYVGSWLFHMGREYFIFFIVMLFPVILMGATFPIVSKIYTQHINQLGTRIGVVGALDTVGSIFGSFVAGFIFIPFLGVVNAVLLTAAINLAIGFIIFFFQPYMRKTSKIIVGLTILVCAVFLLRTVPGKAYFQTWLTSQPEDRLIFYKEGTAATVSIPQHLDGTKALSINGAISGEASPGDLEVHRLEGYLPYLLHDNPENALLIGLGTGVTANCLIQSDMKYVECVEICPEVVEAAEHSLGEENSHVVKNQKFTGIIEDGRSFLLITEVKYDIITSSGIHPRMSPTIYTSEFYQICRDHLTENGVMCKWFPSNWLSTDEFKMLLKSFIDVFPYSSLWVGNASQAILIGKTEPLVINLDMLSRKMKRDKIFHDLAASGMETPSKLLAKFICHDDSLTKYLGDVSVNSDDNPAVEYSRYMNKARNPEIIRDLIDLKHGQSHLLMQKSDSLMIAHDEFERYWRAEKYFMIANIINFTGDRLPDMLNALNRAIELDSTNIRYRESLAIILYKNAKYQEALAHMLRIIELQPDCGPHYENAGRIYFDIQDKNRAFDMFRRALQINPELALSRYYLALLYASENKLNRSIAELKKVIELYPRFISAHFDLGVLYSSLNNIESAKACFNKCLEIQPDHEQAKKLLRQLKSS
ncbi:tetratricopeptide repeat protein [candidate division KSB1 bacterium]|nr:fused MFS/spermidine synthase [candidate division KSB1 bacterium]RQW06974.1 MAG: tetratricopeptide repeat protein [candidate division KSB1 bacterium]